MTPSASLFSAGSATNSRASTISTDIFAPVFVTSAAYRDDVTITSTGAVEPGAGTAAIYMITPGADVTNDGLVAGNGAQYGSGIILSASSTLFNQGTIDATYGRSDYKTFGGDGVNQKGGSLVNTGFIIGGAGDAFGGTGVAVKNGVLRNAGQIEGGAASRYLAGPAGFGGKPPLYGHPIQPLAGGTGAVLSGGTLINSGTIIGAYDSGIGARITNTVLDNTGKITGGTGLNGGSLPYSSLDGTNGFAGGNGVVISGTMAVANGGTIIGGAGGGAANGYNDVFSHFYGNGGTGGIGGDGVAISGNTTFTNAGVIIGGIGAAGGSGFGTQPSADGAAGAGGAGGVGVFLAGGTLVNAGTISGGGGGGGGSSPKYGTAAAGVGGDAVQLGSLAATVVDDASGVFNGLVVANQSLRDSIILAGKSPQATLTGIGTQFLNFSVIDFAAGAQRSVAGDVAGLATGQTIAGFMPGDELIITGFKETGIGFTNGKVDLISAGTSIALDLTGAGARNLLIHATQAGTTITAPDGTVQLAAGFTELVTGNEIASATTVHAGGTLVVNGGESLNAKILHGGTEIVSKGGIVSAGDIAGGTLNLAAGAVARGGIQFSGTGGELVIGGTVMPSQVISGFSNGDTIHLAGVTYAAGASVAVTTTNVVAITDAGKTFDLNIAGAVIGETDFVFGPGAVLTKTAPAMAFLRPDAAASQADSFTDSVSARQWKAGLLHAAAANTLTPSGGAPDLLHMSRPGQVQTFITLHSGWAG
jgi:hypothetical protein